jgi:uncharacterized protein (TIGR02145 family)
MKACLVYITVAVSVLLLSSCDQDESVSEVRDADGNVYHTVRIGSQTWMVEDLKTTTYNDGTPIPQVLTSWLNLETPAYCNYNNLPGNAEGNGRLYNFYAVETGKLCPKGWHVPSDEEWAVLIDYLGGADQAALKLKEGGFAHWLSQYPSGTNESGFSALPSGYKWSDDINGGAFYDLGAGSWWWSSTVLPSSDDVYLRELYGSITKGYTWKGFGLSVRCIKD